MKIVHMKKKQTHFVPYQTYHPRHHLQRQQQQQQSDERLDNKHNDKLAHLIYQQQQTFVTQPQQKLQPTHNCYEQLQQNNEHIKCFNTTIAATDSFSSNATNATNTKMSSLIFGNTFSQTNLQQCFKSEQEAQQQQYTQSYQDYNYLNNNYILNNNNNNSNNFNYNYSQSISNPMKLNSNNNNNNSFYNSTQQEQQREHENIVIKEEFLEEQKKSEQYERRKKLNLSLTTNLLQTQQHQQQQQQLQENNLLPLTNYQIKQHNVQNTINNFNFDATTFNNNDVKTNTTTTNINPSTNVNDKITMDAREIANFLANELFMQQVSQSYSKRKPIIVN